MVLYVADYAILRLMRYAPLTRRNDRWRFGVRTIADSVVERLVAHGRAERVGDLAQLTGWQKPEGAT